MIGGGDHVRRNSVASGIQASPCARVEKRKQGYFRPIDSPIQEQVSPKKARIAEMLSIASMTSSKFGDERMIKATQDRQSLEENCLVAKGEDSALSCKYCLDTLFTTPSRIAQSVPPLSSPGPLLQGDLGRVHARLAAVLKPHLCRRTVHLFLAVPNPVLT
jgi:serine/arginine repetitive matrix protein 2